MRRALDLPIAFAAAMAIVVWYVLLNITIPASILDEGEHIATAVGIARGDWGPAERQTTIPTYHVLAAGFVRICGSELAVLRGFNLLFALGFVAVALCAGRVAARELSLALAPPGMHTGARAPGTTDQRWANDGLQLFIWNPLLFPFLAMFYTDTASALAMLAAAVLFRADQRVWAAILLAAAALLRQSNVVWIGLFAVLAAFDSPTVRAALTRRGAADPVSERSALPSGVRAAWPFLLLGLLAVGVFLWAGRATYGDTSENGAGFSSAQFYAFAAALLILRAPLWLPHFRSALVQWSGAISRSPLLVLLVVALVAALFAGFSIAHPWNLRRGLLRNEFLAMLSDSTVRAVFVAGLLLCAPAFVEMLRAQRRRATLALVLLFSALFLAPQQLVDPRYYIVPLLLLDFYSEWTASEARRLACWYGLLSLAACATLVATRVPW